MKDSLAKIIASCFLIVNLTGCSFSGKLDNNYTNWVFKKGLASNKLSIYSTNNPLIIQFKDTNKDNHFDEITFFGEGDYSHNPLMKYANFSFADSLIKEKK